MEKINDLIKSVAALVYYSQIHTVTGVRAAEFDNHEIAWKKAQQWLWDNCKADENGIYQLKEQQPGPVWVKDSEVEKTGKLLCCRWAGGSGYIYGSVQWDSKGRRWLDDSVNETKEIEILNESPPAGREDDAVEIERRTKIIEDMLKRDMRLNMPGISEVEQESTWQGFKKTNNL